MGNIGNGRGGVTVADAARRIRQWRLDPALYVRQQFKAEPDDWQAEVLAALADPAKQRLAMKASKGPGKTALLAWAIWWFLSCFGEKGNHPKGAATSISKDNLKDNLWAELAKWRGVSPFLQAAFEWTKERVFSRDHAETWFFSARAWSKSGDPQQQAHTLAGMHSKYLLFVLDESGGIPQSVMAAAEAGLAGGAFQKIVQAGNPTHLEGPLYVACTSQAHMWHVVTVNGDPDNPKRSPRVSVEWARQQMEAYGRDNPWVLVNVFGEFPPASINVLLGPEEVQAAMARKVGEDSYAWAQKRLGVDVARFGDDRTVIFPRQGMVAFEPTVMRNARTTDIAARVAKVKAEWGSELEFVDDSGHWGHGVIDNLIAAGYGAMPVLFEGKAIDPRYKNKRTEMWLNLAEWVKAGGSLPNLPELVRELTTPTYTFVNGLFQLEPKDMIKKRIGTSPDLGDALALTFALPELPTESGVPAFARSQMGEGRGKALSEFDPFAELERVG
jgi:phage terminase large subunit